MLKQLYLALFLVSFTLAEGQENSTNLAWLTIEEAEEKLKTKEKKIIIDVYADWCYWCKKIEAELGLDSILVNYLEENYYLVKINPEDLRDLKFQGKTYKRKSFKYSYSDKSRKVNELIVDLINVDFIYPSLIFLDENLDKITHTKGYKTKEELNKLLVFFGDNIYKKTKWADYLRGLNN